MIDLDGHGKGRGLMLTMSRGKDASDAKAES